MLTFEVWVDDRRGVRSDVKVVMMVMMKRYRSGILQILYATTFGETRRLVFECKKGLRLMRWHKRQPLKKHLISLGQINYRVARAWRDRREAVLRCSA